MLEEYFYYPYLVGVFLLAVPWMYFFQNKKFRREMIFVGVLFGIGAILIGQFYALHDYWNPPYLFSHAFPVEDFFYGFFISGVIATFHEKLFKPTTYRKTSKKWLILGAIPLAITILSFYFLVSVAGLNSIIAHLLPPIIVGSIIIILHPHLAKPTLVSTLFGFLLTFLLLQILLILYPNMIRDFWMLKNISGALFINIPIEEYLFGGVLGFSIPFFYESLRGCVPVFTKK